MFLWLKLVLILIISKKSFLFLQLCMENMDRSHEDEKAKGRHGTNVTHHLLDILLRTPVALPHTILGPVDVPMILEHVVPVPGPEQDDERVLPDQPGHYNLLAQQLGPTNETNVG